MDEIEDEIEAIRSIYSGLEEFELIQKGDNSSTMTALKLQLKVIDNKQEMSASLTITLPTGYPDVKPQLSLTSPHLTRNQAMEFRDHLSQLCQTLLGEPMVLELATNLQDNLIQYSKSNIKHSSKDSEDMSDKQDLYTGLLHLDHMRARTRYIKTIQRWTTELHLTGRLVFQDKLILIILQGKISDIKEYIHRQRSVSVDVDSRGKNCKERKLTILDEKPLDLSMRSSEFLIHECENSEELQQLFMDLQLKEMYQSHISVLLR